MDGKHVERCYVNWLPVTPDLYFKFGWRTESKYSGV